MYTRNKVIVTKRLVQGITVEIRYTLQDDKSLLTHNSTDHNLTTGTIKTGDATVLTYSFKEKRTEAQTYPTPQSRHGIQTHVFSHFSFPQKDVSNKSSGD